MKRLYRSRKEKMIAGVSGGMAEYFMIDPVFVRALFIITTIAWGTGLLAYIVLWIIVPYGEQKIEEIADFDQEIRQNPNNMRETEEKKRNRQISLGIILLSLGVLLLLDNLFCWLNFSTILPIIIIAIGAYILLKSTPFNHREA